MRIRKLFKFRSTGGRGTNIPTPLRTRYLVLCNDGVGRLLFKRQKASITGITCLLNFIGNFQISLPPLKIGVSDADPQHWAGVTTYLFNLDGLANSGLIKLLLQHLVLESVLLLAKQK